jgi:hypothetical protein
VGLVVELGLDRVSQQMRQCEISNMRKPPRVTDSAATRDRARESLATVKGYYPMPYVTP